MFTLDKKTKTENKRKNIYEKANFIQHKSNKPYYSTCSRDISQSPLEITWKIFMKRTSYNLRVYFGMSLVKKKKL